MVVRIGIDYDGVLADTQGFVLDLLGDEYDAHLTREDFAWRDGRPSLDADLDVGGSSGFEEFAADRDLVAELDPLPGTRDALWRLANAPEFEVRLATHRPRTVHDAIERWLDDNDLPRLELPASVPDEKARTSPPLDVLVDDYHGHADGAARNGLLGVHLTAAWESGDPSLPETVQASTWDDAVTAILDHSTQ